MDNCSTTDRGYMGDRSRDASLGRGNRRADPTTVARFNLRRVRLDSQGYDCGGVYWGHGGALFEAFTDGGAEFMTVRILPWDCTAAFRRRGGVPIGEPGFAEFGRRFPCWARVAAREAAKDAVREEYPHARFHR